MTDKLVAARRFVDELVRAKQIEVRRAALLAADLATHIEALGRHPTGSELEEWLGDHKQVEELYASLGMLEEIGDRYFRPPAPVVAAVVASQPDLERQLRETLEPDPYLVYADWLQEQGDPFGELIALGVAATTGDDAAKRRFDTFLERNEKQFLAGVQRELGSTVSLEWHNGFITSAHESRSTGFQSWKKLLELRVASQIRSISLFQFSDAELDALIAERVPGLRSITIRSGRVPVDMLKGDYLESLELELDQLVLDPTTLPDRLVSLRVCAREIVRAEALKSLAIRELVLTAFFGYSPTPIAGSTYAPLADIEFPELERLEVRGLRGTFVELADQVLDRMTTPNVRTFALRSARGIRDADLVRLSTLKIAPQITELVLENLELTDDLLGALAPIARVAKLEQLDISNNELSPAAVALAKTFATTVVIGKQKTVGARALEAIRSFAMGRYDAGNEISAHANWETARLVDDEFRATYSGTNDYEVRVRRDLSTYDCSCPSQYQPCKHVIALALVGLRKPIR